VFWFSAIGLGVAGIGLLLAPSMGDFSMISISHLTDEDDHLRDSNISRPNESSSSTENCIRLSPHGHGHAQFRIIIMQKHGGQQLIDQIVHYLQALTYDEIVVVAHGEGNTPLTVMLIQEYVSKGVHLWRCDGDFFTRGDQWSQVIQQYQNTSDYVQGLDVDEYLTILTPNKTSLVWNRLSLHTALKNLPPSSGKPYKTLMSTVLPVDCPKTQLSRNAPLSSLTKHQARHCRITGLTEGGLSCFNKVFFRGEDFVKTDNGNHHGTTKLGGSNRRICEEKGVEAAYVPTNFVLVHLQVLDFQDWFVHAVKVATDLGVNSFDKSSVCPAGQNKPWNPCPRFKRFFAANFSAYELRSMYFKEACVKKPFYDMDGITTMSC